MGFDNLRFLAAVRPGVLDDIVALVIDLNTDLETSVGKCEVRPGASQRDEYFSLQTRVINFDY